MAINTGFQGSGAAYHAKQVVEEARAFKEAVGDTAESFTKAVDLRGRVQRNPFAMVAAAAGVGYVLGGGLFSPLTGRLLKLGLRLALIPVVRSQLANLAGVAGEGSAGSTF